MTRVPGLSGLGDVLPHRRAEAERFAALVDGRRVNGGLADHPELADLAQLARALAPVGHRPDPAFRTALRERLVAEADERPVTVAPTGARPATSAEPGPATTPRWRSAVATVVLAAVVSGAGAAAASLRALPGDSLYGLKRQIESVELALAHGDLDRGRELLAQAEARLGEAEHLAASSEISEPGTRADLLATLADMEEATDEGTAALTDAYRESGDAEPLRILRDFAGEQQARLRDLMALLGPDLRETLRPMLAELASVQRTATLLLGTGATGLAAVASDASVASVADAAALGEASGDGWAVSMLLDRTTSTTADAGRTLAGGGTGSLGGSGDDGLVGGLVDGVAGVLDGSGSGGGSAGSSGGALGSAVGDTVDGVGDTVDGVADGAGGALDPVTSPLASSTPLPTTTPLPSLDSSAGTAPLPTASVCVTLLGVETC